MLKYQLLVSFLTLTLLASAQDRNPKDDQSFKIVSLVLLVGALVLAIWKLKGTYKK